MESSIAVPLTPSAMHSLASNWSQLSSLHLTLSRTDYSAEGLALLQQFTGLKELALGVATGSSNGKGSVENLAGLTGNGEGGTGSAGMMPSCAAGAPRVALTWLPGGLTKLELSCLALDLALPGSGAENEKSQGGSGGSSGAAPKDQGGSGDAGAETYVRHAAAGAEGLVPRWGRRACCTYMLM